MGAANTTIFDRWFGNFFKRNSETVMSNEITLFQTLKYEHTFHIKKNVEKKNLSDKPINPYNFNLFFTACVTRNENHIPTQN